MGYIEVIEKKKVPCNCSTCLYFNGNFQPCGNANNHGTRVMEYQNCGYYWLNQHKYERAY